MGGYIAVEFVRRFAHRVDRLVLISPAGTIPQEPANLKLLRNRGIWTVMKPLAFSVLWVCTHVVNKRKMLDYYSDGSASSDVPIDWKQISKRNLNTALLCVKGLPLWKNEALFEEIGRKARPILICCGEADEITPLHRQFEWLQKTFPLMEYASYPNCHHILLEDASPTILLDICAFFVKNLQDFGKTQMPKTTIHPTQLISPPWQSLFATLDSRLHRTIGFEYESSGTSVQQKIALYEKLSKSSAVFQRVS
eukprot:Gregarina_sp_Pseudo_9__5874@NODE_919_length_2062_cov_23_084034_g862_i0_p2_GENE_NODE_919_length_2062_cov_23_084034_g862_i0NODE_919_length_2062_cov_23_084034_g862_i0_p2_ORF_typecomplete_len252_score38_66Hydrolase_4/PF12146_8/3_4e12Abhydrolase_1/PF00561_20/5_7e11Abhydrolase_6/PF12697_7/5e05Abhydrolase_2/PF02230_16/2_6e02Abhydrolase_2/PF02230_16/0_026DLH/PF01738_18/0_0054BAAT_C/PF08840_11/0_029DUF3141/PF11339_8/0_018Ndr/PF03096_14/0_03Esterase/PF00756_20/0_063DUF1057/PF06342_12/0_31_NODE_919_length_